MSSEPVRFYQTGTFTIGNRLLDDALQTIQSGIARHNSLDSGHRACQGCGEALGARYAVDAAHRASDGKLIVVNATGCLEVFSTPYPQSSWRVPWLHSLFGNAPAVASGVAAALRATGNGDVRVLAQGGDGGTVDIGLGCLSGMFERNDDVLYICYDNEAYMNTGVQRSGSTPPAARTATTQAVGPRPGNPFGIGKNLPRIAMALGIPYVATASVADLHDLESKVFDAMTLHGSRYIHLHVPCPLGWGSDPALTIRVARLAVESGLFPLFEARDGRVVGVRKIRRRVPVDEYLKLQKRFAHLFADASRRNDIAAIQAIADANISEFDLLAAEPTTAVGGVL
jgi:pyruvate ferredoxin oxidoreductase beta subunit